jgi:hypothetical protein
VVAAALGVLGIASAASARVAQPRLTVSSPVSGATVTPPWPVHYLVAGVKVSPTRPVRIRVMVVGQSTTMVFTAKGQTGMVQVPDERFWSGRRDVTFTLLHANGTPFGNAGASTTVTGLIIAGNR